MTAPTNVELRQSLPNAGQSAAERPAYIPLPVESLRLDALIHCQLYLRTGKDQYTKYREPGIPFDDASRQRLRENGQHFLYVRNDEAKLLNEYLEANLRMILSDPRVSEEKKAQVLYTTTVHLARELMLDPTSAEGVRTCRRAVESAAEHIATKPRALAQIMELSSADYYTFTHSVNVMSYSMALAVKMGYPQGSELAELGQSALFHDVGKSYIDWQITNKNGPLSPAEFEVMKQHPDFGFRALKSTDELPDSALFAVRHHHEKLNGKGYPHGLVGSQIDLGVRIVSCADVFDALTTRRVYRGAFRSYPALQLMKEKAGEELDEKVFNSFVSLLGEV